MAKLTSDQLIDAFKELTLIELSDFVKKFEETFEVIAAAPVAVAKAMRDFAKANPLLVVKGGYFDGNPLTAAEVTKLADLESREVLLAKFAGAAKASLFGAAYLFNAPLAQAARAVDALRQKQESGS